MCSLGQKEHDRSAVWYLNVKTYVTPLLYLIAFAMKMECGGGKGWLQQKDLELHSVNVVSPSPQLQMVWKA